MMNKKWNNKMVIPLALCCLVVPMQASAQQMQEEFTLDSVNVTALRYVSKDLDTPADTKVYTNEQLTATGAKNLIEALKYTEGIIYNSMGPGGQAFSSMNSKLIMRGVESGTLVLINGVPANLNGAYYLDQIPVAQVEKVEIVKGGGAVLYGSEAFGGVINIITKTKVENSVAVSSGTNGQNYNIALQAGKSSFIINSNTEKATDVLTEVSQSGDFSSNLKKKLSYRTAFGDSTKNSISWTNQFDDNLTMRYMYSNNEYSVLYKNDGDGKTLKKWDYNDTKNFVQLEYLKDKWKSKIFFNKQTLDYDGVETVRPGTPEWSTTNNTVWGLDTQNSWSSNHMNWLAGLTVQQESYEQVGRKLKTNGAKTTRDLEAEYKDGAHNRNHYAFYGQWDKPITDNTTLILSARQDIVNAEGGNHYTAFCPQFQTLTKINTNSSWYTNVGRTFKMPTFSQMHYTSGAFIPNPDLKPETGMNYEVGYKKQAGHSKFKVALFRTDISDQIKWEKSVLADPSSPSQARNKNAFRNSGIDINYENKINEHLSYSIGGSYGSPEIQNVSGGTWQRTLGRIQLSSSLRYINGPTTATLSAMYYGERVDDKEQSRQAMLPVALHMGYELDKNSSLTFDVDNLLNRQDITTNSSSTYYCLPRSYKLGYTARF